MRKLVLLFGLVAIITAGCGSKVEEEEVSDQALKNASSKFESASSSEVSGGSDSKTATPAQGDN